MMAQHSSKLAIGVESYRDTCIDTINQGLYMEVSDASSLATVPYQHHPHNQAVSQG